MVAEEFVDAVVSAKDDNRPAFRALMAAVRNARRGWDTILIHDTSRLSRSRHTAIIFEHECNRHDVAVVYKSIPDADPLTEMVVRSMFQAWDEWHSLNSRAKGLAGMAENVHQGYRAGGRAPIGYRLRAVKTGAVRDGAIVVKSTLEPDPDVAPAVARYLADRAAGVPRKRAKSQAGPPLVGMQDSSLIGVERNALTYAGHTVWGVHAEPGPGGDHAGGKRRPRSEWMVRRDTHPALIDEAQAEALLQRLQARANGRQGNAGMIVARESGALLGGRLFAPDGRKWWAEADRYRIGPKGGRQRSIARAQVEAPVLQQVFADLASPAFASRLLEATRRALVADADPGRVRRLRDQAERLSAQCARMLDIAAGLEDPAPAMRRIDALERERNAVIAELQQAETVAAQTRAIADVSPDDVTAALASVAAAATDSGRASLRAAVIAVVDRVELDPETLQASIVYRIDAPAGVVVASPRGCSRNPRTVTLTIRTSIGHIRTRRWHSPAA